MRDHLPRAHGSNIGGTLVWCSLRLIEPLIVYRLFALFPPLSYGGLPTSSSWTVFSPARLIQLNAAHLSPCRLVLLCCSGAVAAKQIVWHLFLSVQALPPLTAALGGLAEMLLDLLPILVYLWRTSSLDHAEPTVRTVGPGLLIFILGWSTELLAEGQRAKFKARRASRKGEQTRRTPYTGGLFAWSRHINYFGYTVWRAGLAQCGGGWRLALAVVGWHSWDFVSRGMPVLETYCRERYGAEWSAYERETPWLFLPFVY